MKTQIIKKIILLAGLFISQITYSQCLEIGQEHEGGIIFYIDETVEHGLITATADIGTASWGPSISTTPVAQGITIGTGNQNTENILTNYPNYDTGAKLCANLTLNDYDDWYLPSIAELELLYLHRNIVGSFSSDDQNLLYMSSSEYRYEEHINGYIRYYVYDFHEIDGPGGGFIESTRKLLTSKTNSLLVIPIRSF